jgi:hypothetical protein
MPNYLLHEAAHAVAFVELFGKTRDAHAAMSDKDRLLHVMLGEAFAMSAEYFAACAVSGGLEAWLFSLNSYRHRTQKRKAVGELVSELGARAVVWVVLTSFLQNNFLIERLSAKRLAGMLELSSLTSGLGIRGATARKLRNSMSGLMVMSPEFRRDTARLFLTMHGYSRDVRRVLAVEPLELFESDPAARAAAERLVVLLSDDAT